VQEMSRAATHAATTSSEIADRMTDLADEAGRASHGIEDTRRSATQLAGTAHELREVVARFTV